MTISVRELGGTRIVDLEGEVDRAIRYIDSSEIATLIDALKSAQGLRRDFVVFGLSPAVPDAFRLTHVNHFFGICETEGEAITPE